MLAHIGLVQFILYVNNQALSTQFYEKLFQQAADLNVPGMTEFMISDQCKLGLMPSSGIVNILGNKTPHPASGDGIPRCELYLYVNELQAEYNHVQQLGIPIINDLEDRDWGDRVFYFSDPDGHILAYAEKI